MSIQFADVADLFAVDIPFRYFTKPGAIFRRQIDPSVILDNNFSFNQLPGAFFVFGTHHIDRSATAIYCTNPSFHKALNFFRQFKH